MSTTSNSTNNNRLLDTIITAVESVYKRVDTDNSDTIAPNAYRGFQFSVPQGVPLRRRLKCTSCNHLCSPLLTVTANDCGHAHIVDHRASWQQQQALLIAQKREKAIVAEATSRKRKRQESHEEGDNKDNEESFKMESNTMSTTCTTDTTESLVVNADTNADADPDDVDDNENKMRIDNKSDQTPIL